MPFVVVELWEGRTVEQKRHLVRAITDAMVEHAACKPEHLHVVIHDVPKDSWGRNGMLGIDIVAERDANDKAAVKPEGDG